MTIIKARKNKPGPERFSCLIARRYLSTLFLTKVNEMKLSASSVIAFSGICRGTFDNIKRGGIPRLSILSYLFAASFDAPLITPNQAAMAIRAIFEEVLPDGAHLPRFRIERLPDEHVARLPPSISVYMKHLRTHHLGISMREVCRRYDYCDSRQLSAIEYDCLGVGVGPICYLFNNYLTDIPELSDEEWGTFATLLLHWLFPVMKGYEMKNNS